MFSAGSPDTLRHSRSMRRPSRSSSTSGRTSSMGSPQALDPDELLHIDLSYFVTHPDAEGMFDRLENDAETRKLFLTSDGLAATRALGPQWRSLLNQGRSVYGWMAALISELPELGPAIRDSVRPRQERAQAERHARADRHVQHDAVEPHDRPWWFSGGPGVEPRAIHQLVRRRKCLAIRGFAPASRAGMGGGERATGCWTECSAAARPSSDSGSLCSTEIARWSTCCWRARR